MSPRLSALLASASHVEVTYETMGAPVVSGLRRVLAGLAIAGAAATAAAHGVDPETHALHGVFGDKIPQFIQGITKATIKPSTNTQPAAALFEVYTSGAMLCNLVFTKTWADDELEMRELRTQSGLSRQDFTTFVVAHEAQHCVSYVAVMNALANRPRANSSEFTALNAVGGNADHLLANVSRNKAEALQAGLGLMTQHGESLRGEMISDVMGVLAVQQLQLREGRGQGMTPQQLRGMAKVRSQGDADHQTHPVLLYLATQVETHGKLPVDTADPDAMSRYAYEAVTIALARTQSANLEQAQNSVGAWRRNQAATALAQLVKATDNYLVVPTGTAPTRGLREALKQAVDGTRNALGRLAPEHLASEPKREAWIESARAQLQRVANKSAELGRLLHPDELESLVQALDTASHSVNVLHAAYKPENGPLQAKEATTPHAPAREGIAGAVSP